MITIHVYEHLCVYLYIYIYIHDHIRAILRSQTKEGAQIAELKRICLEFDDNGDNDNDNNNNNNDNNDDDNNVSFTTNNIISDNNATSNTSNCNTSKHESDDNGYGDKYRSAFKSCTVHVFPAVNLTTPKTFRYQQQTDSYS